MKPENIFVTENDIIKIGDFGMASYGEEFMEELGTIPYMSPQIRLGERYTHKCDVWSLGVILYSLIHSFSSMEFCDLFDSLMNIKPKTKNIKEKMQLLISNLSFADYVTIEAKNLILKMLEVEEKERISIFEINTLINIKFIKI